MIERLAWLIPMAPWLAAAWIASGYILKLNRGEEGERQTAQTALAGTSVSFVMSLILAALSLWQGAPGQVLLGPWLQSGEIVLSISFSLDTLGVSLLPIVSLIALLTIKFSVNYLHREPGFQRLFMLLCLFSGAMNLIVMAGNALLAFFGWEIAGVTSYLLIGYAFDRPTATKNAVRAFVTNRVGDAGFILGMALSLYWLGSVEWPEIARHGDELDTLAAGVVIVGFVIAALAKSAQLPFSAWIARALEGPTPTSAIFYGSLMVHAGVILLIRLAPLLEQAPVVMFILALLGLLTVIYGWLSGLSQSDLKSSLMFATTTQVGWMFFWCGMGWFTLAAWHLALHALWRAFQFLASPGLVNQLEQATSPVPSWLARQHGLHRASLQRFWLDPLINAILVRPTISLARDVQFFDEQVVTRLVGLPIYSRSVSSLSQWEAIQEQDAGSGPGDISQATGVAGRVMAWLANLLYWFESHLVLREGGEGLLQKMRLAGALLERVEQLLTEPRYLILLIMATFVVIL
jgi:NADH:ubiquinone oxidoreductase subunit 5 (subunit L)/multisubunit Na+/H+ antiporter MnhA subunit